MFLDVASLGGTGNLPAASEFAFAKYIARGNQRPVDPPAGLIGRPADRCEGRKHFLETPTALR